MPKSNVLRRDDRKKKEIRRKILKDKQKEINKSDKELTKKKFNKTTLNKFGTREQRLKRYDALSKYKKQQEEYKGKVAIKIPKISIDGMFFTNDSFSVVTRGIALGLHNIGMDVKIKPWKEGRRSHAVDPIVRKLAEKRTERFDVKIRISHPDSFNTLVGSGLKIGIGVFETNTVPPQWITPMKTYCDQVWVPSSYVYKYFSKHIKNCYVVPNGFDPKFFNKNCAPFNYGLPDNTFKFVSVGVAQKRKGTDELYRAFTEEFGADEKVALIYKSYGWGNCCEKFKKEGRVLSILKDIDFDEIGGIYTGANCFVLPTRGEGFGLPVLESMACNTPVIVTGKTGHMDFCTKKNSYLLKTTGMSPAFEKHNWQGKWHEPDVEHLKQLMREVYENYEEAKAKAQEAYDFVHKNYTWGHVATQAIETIAISKPELLDDFLWIEDAEY